MPICPGASAEKKGFSRLCSTKRSSEDNKFLRKSNESSQEIKQSATQVKEKQSKAKHTHRVFAIMPPHSTCDHNDEVFVGCSAVTESSIPASFKAVSPVPQEPRRSVHFSVNVVMRCELHINDYTDEEVAACWFTDEEFQAVRVDIATAVQMVEKGALVKDTNEFCRRGLEFRTPEGAEQRQENKETGWDTVLEVQQVQWEHDWYNPDYMASVYHTQTAHCLQVAQFRALRDAQEAYLEVDGSPIDSMEEKGNGSSLPILKLNQKSVNGKGLKSQYLSRPSVNEPVRNISTATTA